MPLNKLQVIQVAPQRSGHRQHSNSWQDERRAYFERKWLQSPESFDPHNSPITQQDLEQCWTLIQQQCSLPGKHVVELGCGTALLSKRAKAAGAHVIAVDIADNCLQRLKNTGIETQRDTLPTSDLPDSHFDLVICHNLIAELPSKQHRHLIAELYRICHPKGRVVISTALDIYSIQAANAFKKIVKTEISPLCYRFAHHTLLYRVSDLLLLPQNYLLWCQNPLKRQKALSCCAGPQRLLRKALSHPRCSVLWKVLSKSCSPLGKSLKRSVRGVKWMETLTRYLLGSWGISHVYIVGKRRNAFSEK